MQAVVIATYNEAENIPSLLRQIKEAAPDVAAIVVDDDSPDGTARIAREMGLPGVEVLVRKAERGYGPAVRDGLLHALRRGAGRVATMDADFSHDPRVLPELLARLDEADVAIGSRYVGGVRVINWNAKRLLLSIFANLYVRTILGLDTQDCTSGFRAYQAGVLRKMKLRTVRSNGYSFLVETLWRAARRGATISEFPIIFEERHEGESKMNRGIIWESIWTPWRLRLRG